MKPNHKPAIRPVLTTGPPRRIASPLAGSQSALPTTLRSSHPRFFRKLQNPTYRSLIPTLRSCLQNKYICDMILPAQLMARLEARRQSNALRELPRPKGLIDFASNDYIGFAGSAAIFNASHQLLVDSGILRNGATGSRLLSGNSPLYEQTEALIAAFHESDSALLFNSGYDANLGFFSAVPQKGNLILFDELCHASIRDGIRLSNARAYKFTHNDTEAVERLLIQHPDSVVYIVTESVFSMDGDTPPLEELLRLCGQYGCYLVIDEAHALGVFGEQGQGLVQSLGLQHKVFARIMTFGKGLGCHGAAVLGSEQLRQYLLNFARSFIYTTALAPHAVATIQTAYNALSHDKNAIRELRHNINYFNQQKQMRGLRPLFVRSGSAIQSAIFPGNDTVRTIAALMQQSGFDVKAILAPTVPEGQERLRICLHSYNSEREIDEVLEMLGKFVN